MEQFGWNKIKIRNVSSTAFSTTINPSTGTEDKAADGNKGQTTKTTAKHKVSICPSAAVANFVLISSNVI